MTARTRVVLGECEVTAPVPRQPRPPVKPFVPKHPRGRHRSPGWVGLLLAPSVVGVRHFRPVPHRSYVSGMAAVALLIGALTLLLSLWLTLAIVHTAPDLPTAPEVSR